MKKLLFVTALDPEFERDLRQAPLGIGYLISNLHKERPGRYETRHVALDVPAALDSYKPDLVAISSTSPYFNIARAHAQAAQARGIPVIVGGIHVSMLPESIYPEMPVGVVGEGERTLVRLLDLFEETGGFPPERLRGIPGLVFRRADGTLHMTERVEHIDPLDQVPMPDRSLGPVYPHTHMFTSRGCPYRCTFCASTRNWPGKVRFFSAAYVVAEIEELVARHHVTVISFYDDLFCANVPRLREIVRLLEERRLLGRIKFTANARANIVTDELAALLKAMNVASVNMGLESGNETTLSFLKDRVTLDQNRQAMAILRRHKLFVSGSFIVGSPQETREQMMDTYRFLKEAPVAMTEVYILRPYPGTPIWEYAVKRGLVSADMDWSRLTPGAVADPKRIINLSEHVSAEELLRIHRKFVRLTYRKILANILWHPYRADVARVALDIVATKAKSLWRSVVGGK